ncbi:hypothetical protein P7K49_005348 [Saguinus oedipus]|uniref:Uncharacterized protein n=1 Tax=Saguinus oedipus TaxID=9490 RepID=A0ABQ9WAU9_SAGOE|nr:hypothetical protein P7K49_005348 [Saguinus oedipus]
MQGTLASPELENERQSAKLQRWERLDHTTGPSARTPEDPPPPRARCAVELQQRVPAPKNKNRTITSNTRGLTKARQQLQEGSSSRSAVSLRRKGRSPRPTKRWPGGFRNGSRHPPRKGTAPGPPWDPTTASRPRASTRPSRPGACMREAEDTVQKAHSHSAETEAQPPQAREEPGGQKQRTDTPEMEPQTPKSQYSSPEQSPPFR